MSSAGPELQSLQDANRDRGLVVWGVSIQDTFDGAQSYWEDQLGFTIPWAADQGFSTGQFFPGASVIGTPAYIGIDLQTMQIHGEPQQGYGGPGQAVNLVADLLR